MKKISVVAVLCCTVCFFLFSCSGNAPVVKQLSGKDSLEIYESVARQAQKAAKYSKQEKEIPITLSLADKMISDYGLSTHATKPVFLVGESGERVKAFNIDTSSINKFKKLPDFSGIRLYFGIKEVLQNGTPVFTLVIVPRGKKVDDRYQNIRKDYYVFDWSEPCPENCPDDGTDFPPR